MAVVPYSRIGGVSLHSKILSNGKAGGRREGPWSSRRLRHVFAVNLPVHRVGAPVGDEDAGNVTPPVPLGHVSEPGSKGPGGAVDLRSGYRT
jgi:hypothetical protein